MYEYDGANAGKTYVNYVISYKQGGNKLVIAIFKLAGKAGFLFPASARVRILVMFMERNAVSEAEKNAESRRNITIIMIYIAVFN